MSKSIKFFIATDVHLGHKQNHPVRKNDSFNAFQQVLSIATSSNADFLLLGGDLFDQVNPSQKTIYKCLDILQHYVQGQAKKDLNAFWTDHPDYKINFSNQNISIKLPVFTIHGNHDYPSNDFGKISICDLLHVSNYANYFGKHTALTQITIKPIIIQKEGMKMKIAVYGLGYIKDHVLNQLFQNGKVKFHKLQNREDYFCLFIFHQNRYKKGLRAGAPALKCVSSKHIPSWMDLTIWGHEHEAISKIDIEDDRKIFQPGSTVITSFIEAESFLKQCLSIEIFQSGEVEIQPVPLVKSYRPMVCRNYEINDLVVNHKRTSSSGLEFDFYSFLDNELAQIIDNLQRQFPSKKPIIRMKVQYSGYEISRCKMLQLKYTQKVGNAESILSFWKRKEEKHKNGDKQVFQAFKGKSDLNVQQKQISEQILIKYIQAQQNRELYYDPRQLYKHHWSSMQKQSNNPKDYLNTYFTKEMEKKSKPTEKQILDIYNSSLKEMQLVVKNKISNVMKTLDLNYSSQQENQQNDQRSNQKLQGNHKTIKNFWEDQKTLLLLKQDSINSNKLIKNYGDNLIKTQKQKDFLNKSPHQQQKSNNNSHNKKQSSNSTLSRPSSSVNFQQQQQQQIRMYSKMEIQQPYQNNYKKQSKPKQGILKNSYQQNSDQQLKEHSHDQQDCCQKAQKTQYDEGKTKNNFNGAHNLVQNNPTRKPKKNAKNKQQQKNQKQKKSVRWSDSEFN